MTTAQVVSTRFRDHPPGLWYLFFAEMWERFSYYGLRAMLVFYITSEFMLSQEKAYGIYGTYVALVYTTPIIGGIIADHILGERKAIIMGGIMIALGHISLALPGEWLFYAGLALIISGTGLFKANISSLLGRLYKHGDHRRDAGFTLFYVGVNLGALIAPLICGTVGELYGWHYGFSIAAFGMILGLVYFFRGLPNFDGHGMPPKDSLYHKKVLGYFNWEQIIYVLAFLSIPFSALMVMNHEHFDYILPVVGIAVVAYMLYISYEATGLWRRNLLTILVLMFFMMSFFALFEQAGSSINFFTKLQIDRNFAGPWGDQIPTTWFQSLNPMFVVIFGPLMAQLWGKLAAKDKEPYTPFKFFLGLFPAAIGFWILATSTHYADESGLISPWWIILSYWFSTIGELCISPVGLSMVTKLAPPRLVSTMMGIWFISIAYGNYLAGVLSKLSAVDMDITESTASLATYQSAFSSVAYLGFGVALLMLVLTPFLNGAFKREEAMKGYNE